MGSWRGGLGYENLFWHLDGCRCQIREALADGDTYRGGDWGGALGAGESIEVVQDAYVVTRGQILAALRYAAYVAEHVPPVVKQAS